MKADRDSTNHAANQTTRPYRIEKESKARQLSRNDRNSTPELPTNYALELPSSENSELRAPGVRRTTNSGRS
eukprot:13292495-Alexandrium_andersonii.AAC.1